MNIALDISPLKSGHKVRGTGYYVRHLQNALEKYYPENNYQFFVNKKELYGEIDIVHFPYFDPFILTLPLKKEYTTVVTVHDLTPIVFSDHFPRGIKGSIKWKLKKEALKKVDAVITDSESSKKDIVNNIGISEDNVHVVYLAAGEKFKQDSELKIKSSKLNDKYGLPEKFIMYVGDVTWNKNLPRIIKAIKKLDITLVLVGKALTQENVELSHPWNNDLKKVRDLIKNDKHFITLGFIPDQDLVTLYQTALLLVMPSLYEGFGLPILEAMQSGCPVVTSKKGSIPEVAGGAAFFVDPESVNSIENGIGEVFLNQKLRKELSEKGLKQADNFSWKKTAQQTIEVYKKVVESRK